MPYADVTEHVKDFRFTSLSPDINVHTYCHVDSYKSPDDDTWGLRVQGLGFRRLGSRVEDLGLCKQEFPYFIRDLLKDVRAHRAVPRLLLFCAACFQQLNCCSQVPKP